VALTTRSAYHRGHLISPMTVCWGDEERATIAARHAMFLPNVSPQHADVNLGSWFALEKWERKTATKYERAIGFSGPVFSKLDEPFRGEMKLDDGVVAMDTFRIPRHFWKVVVTRTRRERLRYAAYIVTNPGETENSGGKSQSSSSCMSLPALEKMWVCT
jgi:DNA/RNA endonuclease G (NUC1)